MKLFKFLVKTGLDVMLNLFVGVLIILTVGGILGVVYNTIKEIVR